MVEVEPEQAVAGFVSYRSGLYGGVARRCVVRACEFRAGRWHDGYLYSRLRDDPSPQVTPVGPELAR